MFVALQGGQVQDQVWDKSGLITQLRREVATAVVGNSEPLDLLLVALLCRGHALIEDVPGVGKTLLARSLATTLGCEFRRIQLTPDVLPSDITGSNIFDQANSTFEFRPGPIFTQVLLADEINRATPRSQSALLEAMAESQVTVDGETRKLPQPFLVLATQNPIELEGTFPLPEAQLDRFLVQVTLGYPTLHQEHEICQRFETDEVPQPNSILTPSDILDLQKMRSKVSVSSAIRQYLVELVRCTRTDPRITLGASPRATLALHLATQARAMLNGRDFVLPDDVKALALPVLGHRLVINPGARLGGDTTSGILASIITGLAVPVESDAVGDRPTNANLINDA